MAVVTRTVKPLGLRLTVACLLACTSVASTAAQSLTDARPRVAVDDDPAGTALRVLDEAGPPAFPVAIRIQLQAPLSLEAIEDRVALVAGRQIPVWLAIPAPATEPDLEPWRGTLRAILERQPSSLSMLEVIVDRTPSSVAAFAVQIAATEARARVATVRVALGGPAMTDPARRRDIYSADLAPYVDLLAIPEGARAAVEPWLQQLDPSAKLAVLSQAATDALSPRRVVDDVLTDFDTMVAVRAWRATDVSASALRGLSSMASLMLHPVSALDPVGVGLKLQVGPVDASTTIRHRVLLDTRTFSTYVAYWGEPAPARLSLSLTLPVVGVPVVYDILAGTGPAPLPYTRDQATGRVQVEAPLTGHPMLVDFNQGAEPLLTERSDVSAKRQLSVAEIIARHQQAQLAQDVLVKHYSATAVMRQFFRPSLADAGYNVVTENRYFVAGTAVEWEELSFSVNGSKWETDRPPFPLLQPEKVLSLPLQLRFDDGYTYTLKGNERIDGFECYVVQFEPRRHDGALYKGTVWIDQRTFARVRVQAIRGGLTAPVVSNEETLRYTHVATLADQPIFLFTEMSARQIVLVAGRNLLVEKGVTFSTFLLNDEGFDAARAAARASDHIMFRETDAGLRYYVKDGDTRVTNQRPTSQVKALAMGVYSDASYAFPLPIFGINYLNFSVGGSTETQLALLFGGVLAAGNIQRPTLGSPRLNASVDFFAIAVPSSDRVYGPEGELESARVLTWPLSTGLNLGWQATPFVRATLQYQIRFDAFVRDRTTAETFQPPVSGLTNGLGGAVEYRRGGYNILAGATWFARSHWAKWGETVSDDEAPFDVDATSRFAKYNVSVSKNVFVGPFQTIYVNAAWFGGHNLDRFVQYQFGMFDDTRIHGVPSSGVRFAELAMVRGSYSFNVFEQYRLDLFAEHAWGREQGPGPGWEPIPGVGAAVSFRAPWNTILRAEVGQSALPERYRGVRATTIQILLLKPMR